MMGVTERDNNPKNIFNMDVAEKKKTARSSRHKKIGSKSKKCTLASDNLTASQMRKLNGPVTNMNLNRVYGWEEFKSFDWNIQRHILETMSKNYCVNYKMLAQMFSRKTATIKQFIEKHHHHLVDQIANAKPTQDDIIKFNKFIGKSNKVEFNDNQIISIHWKEFKNIPMNTKVSFIDYVMDTFKISANTLAKSMGTNNHSISDIIRENDVLEKYRGKGRKHKKHEIRNNDFMLFMATMSIDNIIERFSLEEPENDIVQEYNECEVEELHTTTNVETSPTFENEFPMTEFTFTMEGKVDANSIASFIEKLTNGGDCKVTIKCEFTQPINIGWK